MKKLNEKIGVGVLVAGLVMGGLGLFGGSVAHAGSASVKEEVDEDLLGLELVDGDDMERLLQEMLQEKSIKEEKDEKGQKVYKVYSKE